MSESPIYEGILDAARKEAESARESARGEAETILADARKKADVAVEEERRATRVRLDGLKLKEESAVRNLERLQELKNNDASWAAVNESVQIWFDSYFTRPEARETLVHWIAEASYGLGLDQARVSYCLREKVDESMLRESEALLKERTGMTVKLTLDSENHIQDWGVMLSSLDDKVYYNNTLAVRLRRHSREMKKIIQESTCKAE